MKKIVKSAGVLAVAAFGGAGSGATFGQQVGAEDIEEIVVTATRREQSLQEVPISMVALTGANLELRGIETIADLQGSVPNLSIIGDTAGALTASNFSIRGIPRVGFFVDDIWQPYTSGLTHLNLADIERIEVLRGPQGTLYGRDSTGGSIRIVTKKPGDELSANAKVTVGSNNRRDLQFSVDVPLTETLKSRWSASSFNQDGYVHSVTLNEDLGQVDMTIFSGDLLWEPSDRFRVRAKYSDMESHPTEARISLWHVPQHANAVGFHYGNTGLYSLAGARYDGANHVAGFPGGRLGEWETAVGHATPANLDIWQGSVEVEFDLTDTLSLKSWTAYVDQYVDVLVDYDNAEWEAVTVWSYRENSIFSQEFQLSGTHDRFEWIGGVYYWQEDNGGRDLWWGFEEFEDGRLDSATVVNSPECMAPTQLLGCAGAIGVYTFIGNQDEIVNGDEEGYAVFGEVTVHLTDAWDLTLGARYHDQDVDSATLAFVPGVTAPKPTTIGPLTSGDPLGGTPDIVDQSSFDDVTLRAVLRRRFSEDVMGYVSYSEGFNAGGAAAVETADGRTLISYDPEKIKSYEVGVRSDFLDGRLRLNGWLFHTEWEDIQLESPFIDPDIGVFAVTFITQNAASAEAQGLEAELAWNPIESVQLDLSLGLLDTSYTDFRFGDETAVDAGDTFASAPEETYSIGLQHDADFAGGGTLTTRLDYSWVSGFQRFEDPSLHPDTLGLTDLLGKYEAGDYGLLNARFVYRPQDANWEVAVFGTNLTDERYMDGGFYSPIWELDFSTVGRPREGGIELNVLFD